MSDSSIGIIEQYRNISNKLKKRFLRKPNVTEACESFTALAKQCENNSMNAYAGMCWIAVARCEGSIKNVPGEVACLTRAADQFLECEKTNHYLGYASPSNENLQAAFNCQAHATLLLPEKNSLCVLSNLQVIEAMEKLDHYSSSEFYLKDILKSLSDSLETKLICLRKLGNLYIDNGDFNSALEIYANMYKLLEQMLQNSSKRDDYMECELICLFLLLILKPASQTLSSDLGKLLEKYTWGETSDAMDKNLFILLQSLVLTCQSNDRICLPELEGELWPFLMAQQKDLLHILIKLY